MISRRILESMSIVHELRDFDFFRHQKEEGFRDSLLSMEQLGEWLLQILPGEDPSCSVETQSLFNTLLQISLWGNKCDLSISAGSKQSATGNTLDQLQSLVNRILVDQSSLAWSSLEVSNQTVDIVMDNAGYELFTDLCLADFIISCNKATKVRFRLKNQPWFVSDTTRQDFDWTINNLCGENENSALSKLGKYFFLFYDFDFFSSQFKFQGARWKSYLTNGMWEVLVDSFWTYPHVYSELQQVDPQLYSGLAEAKLVIFKGDLNYRKLVGDINWETTIDFKICLQGFLPTNILSLRTLKADVVSGLENGQAEKLTSQDKDWMINGNWGLIQFAQA